MRNPLSLRLPTSLSLLTFFFVLHSTLAVGSSAPAPTTTTANGSDFIRSSCGTTLYPEFCYTSLSRYASAVQSSQSQLSKAKRMAVFVSNLSRHADYGSDHRAAAAIHDCFSNLDDAVDQIYASRCFVFDCWISRG